MNTGERIKIRRKELNMSVDELAEKLGKNRATVYRYESNEIENFPVGVLEPLAKELKTTPAYLMGWTNDVNALLQHSDSYALSQKEITLIEKYRNCSDMGKKRIDKYIDNIYEMDQAEKALYKVVEESVDYPTTNYETEEELLSRVGGVVKSPSSNNA